MEARATAAWGAQSALSTDRDPLDDLGDLTFGEAGSGLPSESEADTAYTHVSLDDPLRESEPAAAAHHHPNNGGEGPGDARAAPTPPPAAAPPPAQHSHEYAAPLAHAPTPAMVISRGGPDASSSRSPLSAQPGGIPDALASEILPAGHSADLEGVALPDAPVWLWVRGPEKMELITKLGIKTSYAAYLVRTDSTLPTLQASGTEVRRRFSEFEALHKLLKAQYKGYFIPPLPEKSFLEAKIANDDFLRLRRADLQAFLRGIAHHPALRETDAVHIFLLQAGELGTNPDWIKAQHPPSAAGHAGGAGTSPSPRGAPDEPLWDANAPGGPTPGAAGSAAAAASASSAVKAMLAKAPAWASWTKLKQSVGVGAAPARELDEDEVMLRKNKDLIRDLERLLELSCASARSLCSHSNDLCADFHDLSRNMGMLTRFEEAVQAKNGQYTEAGSAAAGRAEDVTRLAHCSAKQSKLWKTLSLKTAASLVALHDYMIIMPEAVAALEEREAALATVWALEDDRTAKEHALQALSQLAPGTKVANRDKRTYLLNQGISSLEGQILSAQEQYEVVKGRNLGELARLGLERGADFRRMMGQFAATQASLTQASAAVWTALANQYGVAEDSLQVY